MEIAESISNGRSFVDNEVTLNNGNEHAVEFDFAMVAIERHMHVFLICKTMIHSHAQMRFPAEQQSERDPVLMYG
ncbi:hypothetical protein J1614_007506 [Plenodomus biglobosus]|nr:hypothetical protein J1614_007506 [Plenodomus biglobosus]